MPIFGKHWKEPPPFYFPARIYYEDTDASGVVYHANYLRYFERARTEWLRNMGFVQQNLRDSLGVVFTVANLSIDFLRPARLDDELVVGVVVSNMRRASLEFRQELRRKGESELLARAQVRVGCVDEKTFRPVALPEPFIQYVESLSEPSA
jgi:acyl-CoA thioester hydrolase